MEQGQQDKAMLEEVVLVNTIAEAVEAPPPQESKTHPTVEQEY
jgi:hypothetical protein